MESYGITMDRRTEQVAANVAAAMSGTNVPTVAEATGIRAADLTAALDGRSEFMMSELLNVGGFLRVRPESLIAGVTR